MMYMQVISHEDIQSLKVLKLPCMNYIQNRLRLDDMQLAMSYHRKIYPQNLMQLVCHVEKQAVGMSQEPTCS